MLHEILLCLAGGPSPLLAVSAGKPDDPTTKSLQSLLSPAEKALLDSLAQDLGQKNKETKKIASILSASHPSIVCRAVSTAVVSRHLASFQQRILAVEREILEENASIVGAYNIVPLSAIVGAFEGWPRKLDWLWKLVSFIEAPKDTEKPCTAALIIGRLRCSVHTGYPDIEVISRDLVKVAETAWLQQVSSWVLYGRHPASGNADFFVTRQTSNGGQSNSVEMYGIDPSLIPQFVSKPTAQSILFIGKSLNQIRDRKSVVTVAVPGTLSPELSLLPTHLAHLSSLHYPLNPSSFITAIGAIRRSLSQNALQNLLPLSRVLQILHILKNFFLLGRGEFAVALITAAEDRLSAKSTNDRQKQSMSNDLASMIIKEGEVTATLARTWTALESLQSLDDEDDEELDQARNLMSLSIKSLEKGSHDFRDSQAQASRFLFDDVLLPTSTTLSIRVPSPLDLFLNSSEIDTYSHINAYLLAIRRAHLRLGRLFLLSVLRHGHQSSKIPISPESNTFDRTSQSRTESNQRAKIMRPVWASIRFAVFFLAELGEYFQGEVVESSWFAFESWLIPSPIHGVASADTSLLSSVGPGGGFHSPRPPSSRSNEGPPLQYPHDPETLTQAHIRYLDSLGKSLLLDDPDFTGLLRRLMTSVDHLSALMQRLDTIQQSHFSEANDGVQDTDSHNIIEEQRVMGEITKSHRKVSSGVLGLIEALRTIDAARANGRRHRGSISSMEPGGFSPWTGGGVDRLLLRFDFGNAATF